MYSPTLEEFLKLAATGNLIPVSRRLLADIETPLSAYRKIRGPDESFLFESVEGSTKITLLPRPEFRGLFRLLEPMMAGYIRKQNEQHLSNLKRLLEA